MIPDDQVEEVRARADIVDIVGEVVSLKKSGKDYKGRCPFHDDKTPSFYVVPAKGFYNCFGCNESGDVFTFVMKRMGLDFVEAVKYVAVKAGVTVREVTAREAQEDPFRPLYEANAFAREYFRDLLLDPEIGARARSYLEGRGIDDATAERFGLGFAPDEWTGLRDAAARHSIDTKTLLDVGLLTTSDRRPEPYDRFRNRIIFPIEGIGGKVLGFGGRTLASGQKGAKYLNSPETPVYHKGEVLYGLDRARHQIRKEESALVVEGYMDVVALSAGGITNAVATLGTAMTGEHARLLARYARRAFLLFDSDAAGQKATFRAADALLEAGVHPSVVSLPPGEDPDTVIRKEGPEALRGYVADAVDVLDRKLQMLDERDYFASIEGIRNAVDRLLPTLRAASDPALRDIYVAKVAERTGVRRETLEGEISRRGTVGRSPALEGPRPRRTAPPLPRLGPERTILLLMTKARDWIEPALERLGPEDFVDPANRAIFLALVGHPELTHPPAEMDPEAARRLEQLLASPEELPHAGQVFDDAVRRIQGKPMARREHELRDLLSRETDAGRRKELLLELQRVGAERRSINPDWATAVRPRRAPLDGEETTE